LCRDADYISDSEQSTVNFVGATGVSMSLAVISIGASTYTFEYNAPHVYNSGERASGQEW
jgi:hypothetical protein